LPLGILNIKIKGKKISMSNTKASSRSDAAWYILLNAYQNFEAIVTICAPGICQKNRIIADYLSLLKSNEQVKNVGII
jgi:hypothetical protein